MYRVPHRLGLSTDRIPTVQPPRSNTSRFFRSSSAATEGLRPRPPDTSIPRSLEPEHRHIDDVSFREMEAHMTFKGTKVNDDIYYHPEINTGGKFTHPSQVTPTLCPYMCGNHAVLFRTPEISGLPLPLMRWVIQQGFTSARLMPLRIDPKSTRVVVWSESIITCDGYIVPAFGNLESSLSDSFSTTSQNHLKQRAKDYCRYVNDEVTRTGKGTAISGSIVDMRAGQLQSLGPQEFFQAMDNLQGGPAVAFRKCRLKTMVGSASAVWN